MLSASVSTEAPKGKKKLVDAVYTQDPKHSGSSLKDLRRGWSGAVL